MSETTAILPEKGGIAIARLLKEYTERFKQLAREVRELQKAHAEARQLTSPRQSGMMLRINRDFESLRFDFNRLRPPSDELTRQVSQLTEHGKLAPAIRLELLLRLADFESAIRFAQENINAGVASF